MSSSIRNPLLRVFRRAMSSIRQEPFTVFVEGNIGSGKTTFLRHFESQKNVAVVQEPVTQWQNVRGLNLLDLMYKDPKKNAMAFQSYVQLSMLNGHLTQVDKPVKMLERSLYSARYCFVENSFNSGVMSEPDVVVLDEWFNWITSRLNVGGNLIVYLRTTPEVVYDRIKQRGRKEESFISMEYLQTLHNFHEDWLIHGIKHKAHVPVILVDGTKNLSLMLQEYISCEGRILEDAGVRKALASSP